MRSHLRKGGTRQGVDSISRCPPCVDFGHEVRGDPGKESTPDRIRTCNPRFRRSLEHLPAKVYLPVSVRVNRCHRDGPCRVSDGCGVMPGCASLRPPRYKRDMFLLSILLSTPFERHTITPFCTTQQQASKRSIRAGLRPLRWGSNGMLRGSAIIAGVVMASQDPTHVRCYPHPVAD